MNIGAEVESEIELDSRKDLTTLVLRVPLDLNHIRDQSRDGVLIQS